MVRCHKPDEGGRGNAVLVPGGRVVPPAILLRLAIRLRLGIPILYALGMLTVFHSWYQTHTALADGIFFVLVGLSALSWVVTAIRKAYAWLDEQLAERAAAHELASRVRQSRASGESAVSTDGLWD